MSQQDCLAHEWGCSCLDGQCRAELPAIPDRLIAELDRTAPKPEEDADGWIKWTGGECPVEPDRCVEVELSDGHQEVELAREFEWDWQADGNDIVAYRILSEGGAA